MAENILCFTYGLSSDDMEACNRALSVMGLGERQPDLIPIAATMLPRMVGEVMNEIRTQSTSQREHPLPVVGGARLVFMGTQERATLIRIMQCCKSVLADPGEVIFAMVTETAVGWTFQYYLDHVIEEHEYMKSHDPRDEPEMKRL